MILFGLRRSGLGPIIGVSVAKPMMCRKSGWSPAYEK